MLIPQRKTAASETKKGTGRRRVAPSRIVANDLCRLPCSQSLYVRSPECLAADCPISALELIDADPGNWPHILALHVNHRLGHPCDEILLLCGAENVLDHIDRNEWHLGVLQKFRLVGTGSVRSEACQGRCRKALPGA